MNTSKRDGTRTCPSNACIFPSIPASKKDSGICRSTSLSSQIARTTTLIPFLLVTQHPAKYVPNTTPFLQFGCLHPTQMDVNNTTHKMNRVKVLDTMHNYLLVQHHFQHTNLIIHMNSRLQYANKKLTSPYYVNYSYITQPIYCEGTLRNFDPVKNYFLFSPLYAKTNRPILVSIEYLQFVEGGATPSTSFTGTGWPTTSKIASPHKKNYRSLITFLHYNQIETLICILVPLLLVWHKIRNSSPSSEIQTIELRISNSNTGRRSQNYNTTLG